MNNLNIFDYTQLAEASYANLLNVKAEVLTGDELKKALTSGEFSATQATQLTDHWSVLAQYRDRTEGDESSFSATLFQKKVTDKDTGKDTGTGEYVFACKGTKEKYEDIVETDLGDLVHDGLAIYQIVDMYNFWQQITAPKGASYKIRVLEENGDLSVALAEAFFRQEQDQTGEGTALQRSLQEQGYVIESGKVMHFAEKDSSKIYTKADDERKLGLGINPEKVTVVGHSLGGHLASAFSRLFPELVDDCLMVNGAGYAYVGTSGIGSGNIQNVFAGLSGADHFEENKILNIIGINGNVNLRPTFLSCFSH